jgi:hypothetical protein
MWRHRQHKAHAALQYRQAEPPVRPDRIDFLRAIPGKIN